ncbi:MAG: ribosome biogenesis GTPase YlqF [Firmicutes bacterium]|nr:ribosome biogenesis GTPase YlqF [Bacillota bacterium]
MAKARRQVEEKLKLVDIVFELLDARIPISSKNPMIEEMIKDKPRLVLLNKADLADAAEVKKWIEYYKKLGIVALATNSLTGNPLNDVLKKSEEILINLREKEIKRGMKSRPFRAMILGIPNVGKSQFINRLAGKNKAKTGDKPGITKMQLYIRAGKDLELLDNPGILWPKFESKEVALHLALIGSIKDNILPMDEVAIFGLEFLANNYPQALKDRYNLDQIDIEHPVELLKAIGLMRGCLLPGNEIDFDRVFNLILFDFRNQAFGNLSLEKVKDNV